MLKGLPENAYNALIVDSTLYPKRLGLPHEYAKLSNGNL